MKSNNLNVCIFLDSRLNRNGVGSYYKDLIDNLKGKFKKIQLIGPDNQTFTHKLKFGFPGDNTQKLHFPKIITTINHIKKEKPDIIILPMVAPFCWLGFFIAKRYKIPYYFVLHNNSEKLLSHNLKGIFGNILKHIYVAIDNFMTKESPNILALNTSQLNGINIKNKKIKIIGTTLSESFTQKPLHTLKGKSKNVLYIGRLSPEKNLTTIIQAASEIKDLHFYFAGDGPLKNYIQKNAETLENVTYLGWVERKTIINTIDKADIILLPSNFETFGTAALEGMSRGKLVAVSEDTGIIKWPKLKDNLFIIKKDKGITDTIKEIHNLSEKDQEKKSLNAALSAKQHTENAINDWVNLLNEKELAI
ncbi:hypothetical protein DID76_01710 [Candidatus Marinamargulisbacteria bacterium SCGC AG-414-C22]|nr:hypothetical protein DID76_01710 [Candidatus Marinamargulisbacteria bacterium SCGC AG-414-C22]